MYDDGGSAGFSCTATIPAPSSVNSSTPYRSGSGTHRPKITAPVGDVKRWSCSPRP